PQTSASVLVALAVSGGVPKNNKAGNVMSVPPAATALIIPAAPAAAAKVITSVPDMLGGSLADQRCNSSPQVVKHQAPNLKLQRSSKPQNTNPEKQMTRQMGLRSVFELGAWCFFGSWSLEFGACH